MYPIDNAAKALFDAEKRQVLRITGIDPNGNAIEITEADVKLGTFAIDRYCCNGGKLEVGTAVAAEMKVKLNNANGVYDSVIFEGTELFVEIGIADWENDPSNVYWIPCGYFTPVNQPRRLTVIEINALDRMANLDRVAKTEPWTDNNGNVMTDNLGNIIYFEEGLSFPCTIANLIEQIGNNYIPFTQDLIGFPNSGLTLTGLPPLTEEITIRDIIQWCAGIMGTNAYVDWNGQLCFAWYDNTTGYSSTTSNRYNSDLYENAIVITGVEFTDSESDDNTVYLAGTDAYALDLSDNYLINTENANTVLQAIYTKIHDFAYTPFSASVVSAPYLWPMDRVTFTDKFGTGHVSSLTNVNFGVNGTTAIGSIGETSEYNKGLRPMPFTGRQMNVLRNIQHLTSTEISSAVEDATAQITGAEGGYVRFIYDANGKLTEIVIMDTEDITTATKVWRWNSGGLGFSSNGYAGPYTTAITQNGAIVADFITAGSMSANRLSGGTIDGSTVNAKLLNIVDADGNVIASFNDTITLGKSDNARAEMDFNSFEILDKSGNTILFAGDLRGADGKAYILDSFVGDGSTKVYTLTFPFSTIVSITINGTATDAYTTPFPRTIRFTTAPANGSTILVNYKTTSVVYRYDFGTRKSGTNIGNYSIAEGNNITASGNYSHAECYFTTASGSGSHAEGGNTTASGNSSHAEGSITTASGIGSHAEGSSTTASGTVSHAEGDDTTASGYGSHAEGSNTTASGNYSHAEGYKSIASGNNSHAEGYWTKASSWCQHVQGKYNVEDTQGDYAEIVGNGTSSSRSNARTLDWSGNEYIAGALSVGNASATRSNLEVLGVSDVVNNLTGGGTAVPLSAEMGKYLQNTSGVSAYSFGQYSGYVKYENGMLIQWGRNLIDGTMTQVASSGIYALTVQINLGVAYLDANSYVINATSRFSTGHCVPSGFSPNTAQQFSGQIYDFYARSSNSNDKFAVRWMTIGRWK